MRKGLLLLLLALCAATPAWSNGAPHRQEYRSGAIVPMTRAGISVVREDLEVKLLDIPHRVWVRRRFYTSHGGVWVAGHYETTPGIVRVRATYLLRNHHRRTEVVPIRFPAENVRAEGMRQSPGLDNRRHGQAAVKLNGRALGVGCQWLEPFALDKAASVLARRWGADGLFLNPRTHRLYPMGRRTDAHLRYPPYPDPYFAFLSFTLELPPARQSRLVVQYDQGMAPNWPDDYQITYVMTTARHWERWGSTHITVRIPRGYAEAIAVSPWPHEHRRTGREHIYRITLGRPRENLHVAIDPVGRVGTSGI